MRTLFQTGIFSWEYSRLCLLKSASTCLVWVTRLWHPQPKLQSVPDLRLLASFQPTLFQVGLTLPPTVPSNLSLNREPVHHHHLTAYKCGKTPGTGGERPVATFSAGAARQPRGSAAPAAPLLESSPRKGSGVSPGVSALMLPACVCVSDGHSEGKAL